MVFRIKINIGLKQDFFIPHFYGNIFILNRPIEMLYRYIFNFHNQIHLMETNVWRVIYLGQFTRLLPILFRLLLYFVVAYLRLKSKECNSLHPLHIVL